MGTVAITSTAIGVILIVALVPLVRRSILPEWATIQVSEQSRKPSQFVRLVLVSLLWAVCLLSTLHFHFSLRQQVIVSHLFYLPIIIASLWWRRRAIPLAVFSGAFLLLSHHFASLGLLTDDIVRSCLFVVVSVTVAWLSEKIAQATTRIRENEELFRSVFDGIQDVFYRTDAEGRVILISPSVQQTAGYTAEEVIGQPASRFYADPAQRDILLEELRQKDTVTDFEIDLRHSDGTVIPSSVTSHIMKDDEGRALGVEGVLRDITEHKRVEEALREDRDRAQKYLDVARVILAVVDADEQISLMNNKGCEVLGYSESELIGQNWFDLLVPERLREEVRGVFRQLMAGEVEPVEYYENPLLTKNGEERIIVFHNTVLTDEDGSICAAVCSGEDVTERKRTEEALRESETKYRTLVENLPQKIFFKDNNSVYISCNESYARDLGLTPDEIVGHTDYDFYPKELAEKYRADDTRIMESAQAEEIEEDYIQDGQQVVVHTVKIPVTDENGRVVGILGIFWDITERKRTEEALQQAYDRVETILATSMDGFMTIGLDGRITDCNETYCEMLGYSRDELLTMRITDVDTMESAEEMAQHIEQVMQTGSDRFETAHRRKDGNIVDVEISTMVVDGPKESFFVSFARDITERKRAEEALRESEEFSASLVSHSSYPTIAINPDTSIRYVNPALEEVTGFSAAELVGTKAPYPFWTEETLEQTGRDLAVAMQQGAQRVEELFETKTGERFWVEITSIPIQRDGKLDYYFAYWADITERKRAEEALQESEQRLRTILETAEDSIFIKDRALRYTQVNPAMVKLFDRPASAIIGTTDWELFGEEAGKHIEEVDLRVLEGETVEEEHTKPVGDMPHTFHIIKVPMRDSSGEIVGVFGIARDITERKRMEADLAQSAKMMSLATMAAGIAHEVRNPLAIICSCTQLLQKHPDDEQIRNQCIEKIDAASQRASLVIANLLKFTHPEEDQVQKVNLNAVLEEASALLAHNMEQQGIMLRKDFQPDLPNVMGTPALLQQVFVNLMLNAGAAMAEGGRLTLTTRRTAAGEVAIEFADTGRGISPEHLPKIFDPFFTAMPSGEGTGLGLAISYGIIQQHKGTIEVESRPGQGSKFTVRLPGVAE